MANVAARRAGALAGHLAPEGAGGAAVGAVGRAAAGAGRLLGEVAVITGAGRGIGEAAAKLFAAAGAKVVVSDVDGPRTDAVCRAIVAAGGTAVGCPGDVTDPAFPKRVMERCKTAFGALTILVNNAGYTWDGVVHKTEDAQWQAMLDVHCTAPFRLIQAAEPLMRQAAKREIAEQGFARRRTVINVSSTSGVHGHAGQANYATAKAGVVGLTKALAKEWGQFNITANAMVFGMIRTRLTGPKEGGAFQTVAGRRVALGVPGGFDDAAASALAPLARVGEPEEAAGAMLALASPLASYISGQAIEVTGGAYI